MSHVLKQIEEMKQLALINAEWQDLVSVEEIAEKTRKEIQSVKEILKDKGLKPTAKLGKTYLYSKAAFLKAIKMTA